MNTFGTVFLAALALATAMRLFLAGRHMNHVRAHRDRVPDAFAREIDLAAHQKAADYTCAKTRFAMIDLVVAFWSFSPSPSAGDCNGSMTFLKRGQRKASFADCS